MKMNIIVPSAEDNQRFDAIYKATVEASCPEFVEKYYKDTGNRWRDIVRVWDKLYNNPKHRILLEAIHKLHWGFYSTNAYDENLVKLLSLIEDEIRSNGEAFRMWSGWQTFRNAVDTILDNIEPFGKINAKISCHFLTHHFYLSCRTRYEIFESKEISPNPKIRAYMRNYEAIMHRLIPESVHWTRAQWADDLNVSNAIEQLYGVDYSCCADDYDRLIELLRVQWGKKGNPQYLWYVMSISKLPSSLIELIWSENTQSILEDLFISAWQQVKLYHQSGCPNNRDIACYFHPSEVFHAKFLKEGWLYAYIIQLFNEGKISSCRQPEIKKALFDLSVAYTT